MLGAADTVAVPTALVVALMAIVLGGVITFVGWQTKQIIEHSRIMAGITTTQVSHDDRISNLEEWRNGIDFGRAVEQHKQAT